MLLLVLIVGNGNTMPQSSLDKASNQLAFWLSCVLLHSLFSLVVRLVGFFNSILRVINVTTKYKRSMSKNYHHLAWCLFKSGPSSPATTMGYRFQGHLSTSHRHMILKIVCFSIWDVYFFLWQSKEECRQTFKDTMMNGCQCFCYCG